MNRSLILHCLLGAAVFLATLFFVSSLAGDCLHAPLDEGIYLEGGERLLEGQVPYRDFFAFTGPLIYWLQAGLEHTFGRNMPMLRLSATASLALMTLVAFAITTRLTDWGYGLGTAFVYLGYISASTYMIIANHRWVSAAFACLALWAAFEASGKLIRPALLWFLAGIAAAAAAWTTPSFVVGIGVYLLWLAFADRRHLLPFCGGVLLVSVPSIVWLAAHGALLPMIENLGWVASRYGKANSVPYAYNPSGWEANRWGDTSQSLYIRVMAAIGIMRYVVAPVAVPLMLVTYGLLAWRKQLDPPRQLLVLGAAAIFFTCYPRWDVNQMLFIMAPFAILIARLAFRLPQLAQPLVTSAIVMWAVINYSGALRVSADDPYIPTRAGTQRAPIAMATAYERLESRIPEGATLFTYPYLPSLGFALHTRNPIRYSFMQPGMMSKQDEAKALLDLQSHPPRFILRQFFPPDQILNTWPNSDRSTLVMHSIEQFFDTRYHFVERVQSIHFDLQLVELNP